MCLEIPINRFIHFTGVQIMQMLAMANCDSIIERVWKNFSYRGYMPLSALSLSHAY